MPPPTAPIHPTGRVTTLSRADLDLSVALCTWNGERWITAFLDSLAAQEHRPDELVVLDDASDDDTVAIVERFARTAPFDVRVEVNPQRVGSTANFAKALERCRGRYIALADQDDVWYPSKLRRAWEEFESDSTVTLVFSDADLIGEDGRRLNRHLWDSRMVGHNLRRHSVVPEHLFARRAVTTGCTMVIRRRAAEAALPFPPELDDVAAPMRHDRWLSMVAAAVGTVRALPEPLLAFRVHPHQQTGVLVGPELGRALRAVARSVVLDSVAGRSEFLHARCLQLGVAADRATLLGDFQEATVLREIADSVERRARIERPGTGRLRIVADGVRSGAYPRDVLGIASLGADIVRAVKRPRPESAEG